MIPSTLALGSAGMDVDAQALEDWARVREHTEFISEQFRTGSGAGTLVAEHLNGSADYLIGAYEEAAQNGFGFVVYATPMSDGDE